VLLPVPRRVLHRVRGGHRQDFGALVGATRGEAGVHHRGFDLRATGDDLLRLVQTEEQRDGVVDDVGDLGQDVVPRDRGDGIRADRSRHSRCFSCGSWRGHREPS
jgi:hypothetical protein